MQNTFEINIGVIGVCSVAGLLIVIAIGFYISSEIKYYKNKKSNPGPMDLYIKEGFLDDSLWLLIFDLPLFLKLRFFNKETTSSIYESMTLISVLGSLLLDKCKSHEDIKLRHLNDHYTDFEQDIIIPVCTDKYFPYYFYGCYKQNVWSLIKAKVKPDERIDFITLVNHIPEYNLTDPLPEGNPLSDVLNYYYVQTNQNNAYLLKINETDKVNISAEFLKQFSLNDILDISYKILDDSGYISDFGLPSRISINFKNNKSEEYILSCATAETIKEFVLTKSIHSDINKENIAKRQIKKIMATANQSGREDKKLTKESDSRTLSEDSSWLSYINKGIFNIYDFYYEMDKTTLECMESKVN